MFESHYNQSIPRLEKAFKLIEDGEVVLLEYGRAIIHGYKVNFTSEKCECKDFTERKAKCKQSSLIAVS